MRSPDDKDSVIARYMEGPILLEKILKGVSEADLDTAPVEGGWTIRQIIHHLADGDDIWKTCIKQALGNEQTVFSLDWYRTLPQKTWAERWAYKQRPIEESLALLKAIRNHVIQLIEHVPGGWNRALGFRDKDDKTKIVPVGFVIEMQANHIMHHLQHIEKIVSNQLHKSRIQNGNS